MTSKYEWERKCAVCGETKGGKGTSGKHDQCAKVLLSRMPKKRKNPAQNVDNLFNYIKNYMGAKSS